MSATSPLGALGALGIALLTVGVLQQRFVAPLPSRQFSTLDGLRGYAAFFVFLHHSAIWYGFLRTGTWALRWSKLLEGRACLRLAAPVRLPRAAPDTAFVLLIALLWIMALTMSGGRLLVSAPRAALQTLQRLTFTVFGMPNINFAPTAIVGGPARSLP